MPVGEPFVTYLELRASNAEGEAGAGLSHTSEGLVLLHVLELAAAGEPRGAVTIVHDAGDHGGRWLELARSLADAGWSVALPDLRGHGRSEGERGHTNGVKEVVRDLGDVQDHLAYRQPDAPKVLVGHGLGAIWALAYACERPDGVAGLVLSAPLVEPRFVLPEKPSGLKALFKKVGPTSPGRIGWTAEQRTSDAKQRAALASDAQMQDLVTLRAGEEALAAAQRYAPRAKELSMPVLVLAGSKDPLVPVERARSLAGPRAEVQVLDGFLHDLFHEARASEARASLVKWLDAKLPR